MSGRTYWHRRSLEIACTGPDGEYTRTVPAWVLGGLAVHRALMDELPDGRGPAEPHELDPDSWVITQVRTGGRVSYRFPSRGKAQRAARRIAEALPQMIAAESPAAFFEHSAIERREWMLTCYGICETFGGLYSPGRAHNGGEGWPVVSGCAR